MKNANAPSPGMLKIGRIIDLKQLPNRLTTPRPISISTQIKKGSSAGRTTLNQRSKPSCAAAKDSFGKIIMNMTSMQNISASKIADSSFLNKQNTSPSYNYIKGEVNYMF